MKQTLTKAVGVLMNSTQEQIGGEIVRYMRPDVFDKGEITVSFSARDMVLGRVVGLAPTSVGSVESLGNAVRVVANRYAIKPSLSQGVVSVNWVDEATWDDVRNDHVRCVVDIELVG